MNYLADFFFICSINVTKQVTYFVQFYTDKRKNRNAVGNMIDMFCKMTNRENI